MGERTRGRRPLVAALLAMAVTGLGHVYLRRWTRALGWLAVGYATVLLFVPESAVKAVANGEVGDPLAFAPVVLVGLASAVDAYRIALFTERSATGSKTEADDSVECPACGKPVDPELGFCHWCTTELVDLRVARTDDGESGVETDDGRGD
jgi:hypothetical protein